MERYYLKKMKRIFLALAFVACATSAFAQNRAMQIVKEINNPKSKKVIVASHRGDWRNHPENSIPAMKSAIDMGVDIIEIDLALTKDSALVVCHDRTLDRTTTGKGLISEWTLDSIKGLTLRSGHNGPTELRMPTLREALLACKDRAVINIDKGYQYYDMVIAETDALGMTDQVLIKGNKPLQKVKKKLNSHKNKMIYMPIVDYTKKDAQKLADGYLESGIVPVAYEIVWPKYTPEVQGTIKKVLESGSKLWVNALWRSHNDGLCDDAAAYGDPAKVYGELLKTGASMVQTDRPQLLLTYLRSIGRHD